MVCGDIPYSNAEEVCKARIWFRDTRLTDKCQDIIGRCLKVQPSDRPTLEDLLNHPWMSANLLDLSYQSEYFRCRQNLLTKILIAREISPITDSID